MCGIAGIIGPEINLEDLQQANALLAHRGPDDAGIYHAQGIGLAVRRLRIVDLEGGRQPLFNEDRSIILVCNGEIFNAPALRHELEAFGHRFSTRSDTETILHAYEQWGEACAERLRGMFAFALWDERRQRLLLSRDRFGMKPLYYARCGELFAFASEIRALFRLLPGLPRRANLEALWRVFEVAFSPTPLTVFQNVYQLEPAHLLLLEESQTRLHPYWTLRLPKMREQTPATLRHASQSFIEQVIETLSAWRMSDVPVGSLLSGGIDSAALSALFCQMQSEPLHTFNIGLQDWERDEAQRARQTAHYIGSQHHQVDFHMQDFDHLPQVVRGLEQPQSAATSLMLYLLYRECHVNGFKVVITGEGSDELLGGYPWYQADQRLRPLLMLPDAGRSLVWRLAAPLLRGSRRVLLAGAADPIQRFAMWIESDRPSNLSRFLNIGPFPSVAQLWRDQYSASLEGLHPLHQFLLLEHRTRLVNFINLNMDRLSMAHSVEARPPYLDHLLWEFTAQFPPSVKLNWRENKRLLRHGMMGRLPDSVRRRPKLGLTSPDAFWWRSERLPAWAEELLTPHALAHSGYFKSDAIIRLRQAHKQGRTNASRILTAVLTTQIWHSDMIQS